MGKITRKKIHLNSDQVQEVCMLLPMFIGFLLFTIYPVLWAVRWALFDYKGYGTPIFVGLDNFVRAVARDSAFWLSLANTFFLAFWKLIIEMPLAIILAYFINDKVKGRSFFRIAYFMPTVLSVAVIGVVFTILFSAYNGIVNAVLMQLNFITKNVDWFQNRWLALSVMLMVSLWTTFGLNMMYFLMALQNIPKDLYDCAMIDGASGTKKFFYITLPLLGPTMQIVFMLSMLGTMRITDLVLVMTNGQPGGSTEVAMTYIFKLFFQYGDAQSMNQFGYGSALTLIVAFFLAIITTVYLKVSKRMKEIY